MLTIPLLIEFLQEFGLSNKQINSLNLDKIILEINKELYKLTAKLLKETIYEKNKDIDRSKLLDIQGRQRKKQIELAKKYKISFPSPGGGCLLCEKEYCKKLKPILNKKINYKDIKLLSIGRHFLSSSIILGRNEKENKILEKQQGIKLVPREPGPTALIKNKKLIKKAKELIQKYSKHKISKFFRHSEF